MAHLTENPFASTNSLDANPFDDQPTAHSAINFPPPQQTRADDQRLQDLERRERELEAREREINARAEYIRQHGVIRNFPPFYPLIYHSIKDEIPEAFRRTVTHVYWLWLLLLGTLIVNMIACVFILTAGSPDGGRDLGASLMYLFVIGILSFLLWYRPLYNALMKEQSLYYYLYFFFGGWHIIFAIYMVIGIPGTGAAGIFNTIGQFGQGHPVSAALGCVASTGWVVHTGGLIFYYIQIWRHHNEAGHSLEKAKTELATNGAKAYFSRA